MKKGALLLIALSILAPVAAAYFFGTSNDIVVGGNDHAGIVLKRSVAESEEEYTPPTDLQFLGVGHSYVKGTISGLGVTDNSYRREMYYRFRSEYGMEYTFVGSVEGGDIPTPYHNGVAGEDSDGLDDAIDGYLDAAFGTPTTSDCVLLGPIGFADCLNEVPLATFNSNLDSIIGKITAHSALIKIFVITDPWVPYGSFPGGQDIDDYADEVRTVFADALANGDNVYKVDINVPDTENINIGTDDIHPDYLGYQQMGEMMVTCIASGLTITAVADTIIFQDTFTDTNGVLMKNHTPDIDTKGNGWVDADDRFDIDDNEAEGTGGYAFTTQVDIEEVVWNGEIKMYQSVNGTTFYILKSNDAMNAYLYLLMNTATNLLYIYNEGGVWAQAAFTCSTSTWYTFKINVRGNSVEISDTEDALLLRAPLLTYGNYTRIGLSYWPGGACNFDDLLIKE